MKKIGLIGLICLFLIPLQGQAVDIIDGDLIRAEGDMDVYIVKIMGDKKFKRLILNPAIFNQYGHLKWENVKDVSQEIVNQYITSDLIRVVGDDKVYKLYSAGDIGEKRWIKTADDFLDLAYDWDAIYEINNFERDYYIPGEDLEADRISEPEPEPESEPPVRDPITINVPGDYSTIQAAIDAAINGDTISVNSGTYNENIVINKNIKLIGNYAISAVIDGQGNGPAISIEGADDFLIQRFTIKSEDEKAIYCSGENLSKGIIKNTTIKDSGSGIYIEGNCDFTILNNLIFDNKVPAKETGFGIFIKNSELYVFTIEVRNNSIDSNYHGIWAENVNLKTMNNIITNNVGLGISAGIYHSGDGTVENTFNNVWQNGWNYKEDAKPGSGSLAVNPRFVQPSQENYKLKTGSTDYSPCLDAGNPEHIYNDKTYSSNTARNDMGAYGGPDNWQWNP
jgi:nitrous oxidase accessory protein NosD